MINALDDKSWSTSIGTLNRHVLKISDLGEKTIKRSQINPVFPGRNSNALQHSIQNVLFNHKTRVAESYGVYGDEHLIAFVEGESDPEVNLALFTASEAVALLKVIGNELAKIHSVPLDDLPSELNDWFEKANEMLAFAQKLGPIADADCQRFARFIELAEQKTLPATLIHNDFRTGNYLVHEGTLTAILDFDLSCRGHPWLDLSWFATSKWRYQNQHLVAGGLAPFKVMLDAYNCRARTPLDTSEYAFWMAFSASRLAVMAHVQRARGYG